MSRPASLFTPAFKRVELAAILVALGVAALYAPRLWAVGWLNVPVAVVMLLAADFLSGVVHWACDTWGDEGTPLLGPNIIRSFREHHTDQLGITRHSFVEANGGPAIGAIPILVTGLLVPSPWSVAFFWIAAFVFVTNVIHGWSHGGAPRPVRWLQRIGLVLSPKHHAVHHRYPHDRAYCITVGWWNPLLDRVRFWERLERAISATTGAQPHRG